MERIEKHGIVARNNKKTDVGKMKTSDCYMIGCICNRFCEKINYIVIYIIHESINVCTVDDDLACQT